MREDKMSSVFTKEEQKSIAATILEQLGGGRFQVMTGAKDLTFGEVEGKPFLQFRIGRNGSKANIIVVELDAGRDLYNMKFLQLRKMELKELESYNGIFFDQLQELFTEYTGLYTSL
jgi:hypothetical protein